MSNDGDAHARRADRGGGRYRLISQEGRSTIVSHASAVSLQPARAVTSRHLPIALPDGNVRGPSVAGGASDVPGEVGRAEDVSPCGGRSVNTSPRIMASRSARIGVRDLAHYQTRPTLTRSTRAQTRSGRFARTMRRADSGRRPRRSTPRPVHGPSSESRDDMLTVTRVEPRCANHLRVHLVYRAMSRLALRSSPRAGCM